MSTVSLQDCSLSFNDEAEENSESFLYPSCELKDEPSLNEGEKKRVEVSWVEVSHHTFYYVYYLEHLVTIYPKLQIPRQGAIGHIMLDRTGN